VIISQFLRDEIYAVVNKEVDHNKRFLIYTCSISIVCPEGFKNRNMPVRRLKFVPVFAEVEAVKLKKFSDADRTQSQ
jgi:hypothetical protein